MIGMTILMALAQIKEILILTCFQILMTQRMTVINGNSATSMILESDFLAIVVQIRKLVACGILCVVAVNRNMRIICSLAPLQRSHDFLVQGINCCQLELS